MSFIQLGRFASSLNDNVCLFLRVWGCLLIMPVRIIDGEKILLLLDSCCVRLENIEATICPIDLTYLCLKYAHLVNIIYSIGAFATQ
jgi:hypothetical protein